MEGQEKCNECGGTDFIDDHSRGDNLQRLRYCDTR